MRIALVNLITKTPLHRRRAPEVASNKDAMIVKFAKAVQECGHDVEVFISDCYRPKTGEELDVPVHYLKTRLRWLFWPSVLPFTPALAGCLRDRFDLIVCFDAFQLSTMLSVWAKAKTQRPAKLVISQELSRHQRLFFRLPSLFFYHVILKFFLDKHIDLYIPRGDKARDFLLKIGIDGKRVAPVVYTGIDENVFFPDPAVEKENVIFSPSILRDVKGIDILIKGFAQVQRRLNGTRLVIQGDGPLYDACSRLIEDLNMEDHIVINRERVGHDRMRRLYCSSLMTVVASRKESSNFSVIESIACGTPVILSTGLDNHVNFSAGEGAVVFKNGDTQGLGELICRLTQDPSARAALEEKALRLAQHYKNSAIAREFLTLCRTGEMPAEKSVLMKG
jgi:glycosyltransferase involved in cell wall biosynthesis